MDRYQQLFGAGLGERVAEAVGLPVPATLRRHSPGAPLLHGPLLLGRGGKGQLADQLADTAQRAGVDVRAELDSDQRVAALVFDASQIDEIAHLEELYDFVHGAIRRLDDNARVLVLGGPVHSGGVRRAATQRALDGFTRSLAKELRAGATANLLRVGEEADGGLESTLRFFLSGRSAFVSGQVVSIEASQASPRAPRDWERPLADKVAVVTGAARGIGAATAQVLARDGAHVVCVDLPASGDQLAEVANGIGGSALQLDITSPGAAETLVAHLKDRHGGVDVVVHNAGITRDKTIAGMDAERWRLVVDVNLASQERVNEVLQAGCLRDGGRIVCVSSLSGIAGNRGQTNYAASKAGVIGMVEALAPRLSRHNGTANAVAPGFIETVLTGQMPLLLREAGRRMNTLRQAGLPVDVAETIAWLASPGSAWVNGQTVRVCGQSLLGA